MAKGNNKGAVIFLAIISIAALSLSGYLLLTDLLSGNVNTNEEPENFKLVALWDNLNENTSYAPYNTDRNFLVEYFDEMVLNTEYVTVHNNTKFSFSKMGLYRINLNILFEGIINTAGYDYWAILTRNTSNYRYFDRWENEDDPYHFIESSMYINVTNSETTYGIIGYSGVDDFAVASTAISNQLSIEYIVP